MTVRPRRGGHGMVDRSLVIPTDNDEVHHNLPIGASLLDLRSYHTLVLLHDLPAAYYQLLL